MSRKTWGADRETLLYVYKAFIRSVIDYGSNVYGSVCDTHLQKLETIQNSALSIATGALRSTPVPALRAETSCCSIRRRISENTLSYFSKSRTLPSAHPIKEIIDSAKNTNPQSWSHNRKKPAIFRAEETRTEYNIPNYETEEFPPVSPYPPWNDVPPTTHTDMDGDIVTRDLPDQIILKSFTTMYEKLYKNSFEIYTDGSKTSTEEPKVGCSVYIPATETTILCRLPSHAPIASAELHAILLAITWIKHNHHQVPAPAITIFSDSQTALQMISKRRPINPTIIKIRRQIEVIETNDKKVTLQWCPAHLNINGNEKADAAAKQAAKLNTTCTTAISKKNIKTALKTQTIQIHEQEWTKQKSSFYIGKFKNTWQCLGWESQQNRRIETAMARLRLGCGFNKAQLYKMKLTENPNCDICNIKETQEHIILECAKHYTQRVILLEKTKTITGTPTRQITLPLILGEGLTPQKQANLAEALIYFLENTAVNI